MKKLFLLLSAITTIGYSAQAQTRCATDEVNNRAKALYPEIAVYEAQLKAEFDARLEGMDLNKMAKTTINEYKDEVVLHVPVVFHIVHDYGTEYISDNEIYETLGDINRVYSKTNPDTIDVIPPFKGNIPGTNTRYIGNARIQFHLAQRDPNGNPTKGIVRERSYLTGNAGDQAKFGQWPPQSYMNIWIIKSFDSTHEGAGAYAYKPGSVNGSSSLVYYDGVICLVNQMTDFHTLSHELAHTLNIDHTWGSTNDPNVQCGDDGIDDTPPTKGHDASGCVPFALYDTNCSVGYDKAYSGPVAKNLFNLGDSVTGRTINYPDTNNSQNIMDYTFCAKMFTYLQTVGMRVALRSTVANRNNLMDTTNLVYTGIMDASTHAIKPRADLPPVPDFSTNSSTDQNVFNCVGQNINFTNRSWNDTITKVDWVFTDGNSVSANASSLSTVSQSFANPGWVSVSVTATSNAGVSTVTKDSAVYVAKNTGTLGAGYFQEFNPGGDLNEYPIFNHYKNDNKWAVVNYAGYFDNTSICMNAYDMRPYQGIPKPLYNTPIGDIDEFYTPPFDLTSYTGDYCNLSFMISGASSTSNPNDMREELEISYRSCGSPIWVVLKRLTKTELQNVGNRSMPFVPSSYSDWESRSYNIPKNARTSNVYFRFKYKSSGNIMSTMGSGYRGTGNNVYLDRIYFNDSPTGVNDVNYKNNGIALAPNPTTEGSSVVIKGTNSPMSVKVQVTDVTGKLIYSTEATVTGDSKIDIPAQYISVKGVYMVNVITGAKKHTEKLVVY